MIIGYIILMIFINTDVNLMSTCLVSRFAWQGWVTKFKLLQDSMLTPWHTIRTVVNWLCIWFIGLVDDWIFFVHLKSRLWNAFVKTEVQNKNNESIIVPFCWKSTYLACIWWSFKVSVNPFTVLEKLKRFCFRSGWFFYFIINVFGCATCV